MFNAHDIEILTIAHCDAPAGSALDRFEPPAGELRRLLGLGLLRVARGTLYTIDRATGAAHIRYDEWHEPTAAGDAALGRAMLGRGLSEEARRILEA